MQPSLGQRISPLSTYWRHLSYGNAVGSLNGGRLLRIGEIQPRHGSSRQDTRMTQSQTGTGASVTNGTSCGKVHVPESEPPYYEENRDLEKCTIRLENARFAPEGWPVVLSGEQLADLPEAGSLDVDQGRLNATCKVSYRAMRGRYRIYKPSTFSVISSLASTVEELGRRDEAADMMRDVLEGREASPHEIGCYKINSLLASCCTPRVQ